MRRSHYIFFTLIVGALVFSQYDAMKRIKQNRAPQAAALAANTATTKAAETAADASLQTQLSR